MSKRSQLAQSSMDHWCQFTSSALLKFSRTRSAQKHISLDCEGERGKKGNIYVDYIMRNSATHAQTHLAPNTGAAGWWSCSNVLGSQNWGLQEKGQMLDPSCRCC